MKTECSSGLRHCTALLLMLFAALASGCAATLRAEVTTFSSADLDFAGKRYQIRPEAVQIGSLEFESYAAALQAVLGRYGLQRVSAPAPTDLAVTLRYSAVPSVANRSEGGASIGIGGGGFSVGAVGIGIGIQVPIGGSREPEVVGYRREVQVQIDRVDADRARVFEGRAVSEGSSASLAPVISPMLRALFDAFPGRSGTTRVIEVPLEE